MYHAGIRLSHPPPPVPSVQLEWNSDIAIGSILQRISAMSNRRQKEIERDVICTPSLPLPPPPSPPTIKSKTYAKENKGGRWKNKKRGDSRCETLIRCVSGAFRREIHSPRGVFAAAAAAATAPVINFRVRLGQLVS